MWVWWLTEETLRGFCLTNIVPYRPSLGFGPRDPRHPGPEGKKRSDKCSQQQKDLTKEVLFERRPQLEGTEEAVVETGQITGDGSTSDCLLQNLSFELLRNTNDLA